MPELSSTSQLALSQAALSQQLTTLLDTVVDGIVVIDDRGRILSFNKAAVRIFGYTPKEAIGKNVSLLMPEPHRSRHDGFIKRYVETGEARIIGMGREVEGVRKDGSRVPLDLAVSEMWIDGGLFFTGVLRDVSERKLAEAQLAAKNKLLKARSRLDQIENSIARIFSLREPLKKSLQQVLGVLHEGLDVPVSGVWTYDEWSGLLKCMATHGAPSDLQRSFEFGEGIVGQVAEDQQITVLSDAPISIDTGLTRIEPSAVVVAPLLYQERLLGVLVLAFLEPLQERERPFLNRLANQLGTSLHNLKQYEDLLELSRQLNARSREIARQNRELERANRLKSEFLANMSHELRTPLNAIIGFSEVLRDQLLGELNEEQLDYTNEIFTAGRHLLDLINEILDLAKIEAGKMELHLESIHPARLSENAAAVVREQALDKRIELEVDVDLKLPEVFVDIRKTRQILFNLLSNAVKFTPEGGRVSLSCRRAKRAGEDELVIAVEDTGIGISPDDMERLFRPFEQVDGSIARRFEGTGLGLAIVEKLTTLHGGRVQVDSQRGAGSTFTVVLPWRETLESPDVLPASGNEAVGSPLILLAASSGEATSRVNRTLKSAGYRVRVSHPDGMIEACRTIHPDVVVLEVSGSPESLELLVEMRATVKESIPVVLLTVDGQAERGLSLGAAEVLSKPVKAPALLEAIQTVGLQPGLSETRVLVVDDDPRAVDFVSRQLEDAGLNVIRAFGGAEAIELVQDIPDLVILDLMMPEVSGLHVIEAMQREPSTAAIPIIVLTARVLEPREREQLTRSVSKVLEKRTFQTGQLLREIHRALSRETRPAVRVKTTSGPGGAADAPDVQPASLELEDRDQKDRDQKDRDQKDRDRELVLVVESRMTDRQLFRIYLEGAGLTVASAQDAKEAISFLKGGAEPALIVVDLASPVVDGYELLAWLADHSELASVPVVATTTHSQQLDETPAVTAFLSKPIGRQPLLDMVATLLGEDDGHHSVLVVDDNPNAVSLLKSYLDSAGIETTVAYSGQDALESIASSRPRLVLLDLMMPGMSGFEVLDKLRDNPDTRSIPVIIVTARVLSEEERRLLEKQANAINQKGELQRNQLIEQVRSLLEVER